VRRGATFSPCGAYRYRLTRRWQRGDRIVTWVMLNPSTADAQTDDPTIRRVIGFSRSRGFDALVVVNLFALRTPSPALLARAADPIGPLNPLHLRRALATAGTVVVAWGAHAPSPTISPRGCVCLGKTKGGSPRHPLYVRSDIPFVGWEGGNDGNLPGVELSEVSG
jgi:hypothetical protein